MPITRDSILLAATVLAWLAFAMSIGQTDALPPLMLDFARTAAYLLTAAVVVRLIGRAFLDLAVEGGWGVAPTSLIRLMVYGLLGALAAAVVFKSALDVNIATLLTTSALLTAILGLAMQSTLSGLFAGLALQIENRIRLGDVIRIDNRPATVEIIGWRSVTARRLDRSLIVVPNTVLGGQIIAIRRPGQPVMTELTLPGPLSVAPATVQEIIEEMIGDIEGVADDLPVTARLAAVSPSSGTGDFRVRFFTRENHLDDDPFGPIVRFRLWYAYQRHGIALLGPPPPKRSEEEPAPPPGLQPDHPKPVFERTVAALKASRRWREADAEASERLARAGTMLLYAPGEPIRLPRGIDRTIAVVVSGGIRLHGTEPGAADIVEPPPSAGDDAGPVTGWDLETLLEVEARLGEAIGPYARLAVRRAAQTSPDLAALHRALAPLIKHPAARAAFLNGVPQDSIRDFGAGTVMRLERGPRPSRPALAARSQVELLALSEDDAAPLSQESAAAD